MVLSAACTCARNDSVHQTLASISKIANENTCNFQAFVINDVLNEALGQPNPWMLLKHTHGLLIVVKMMKCLMVFYLRFTRNGDLCSQSGCNQGRKRLFSH